MTEYDPAPPDTTHGLRQEAAAAGPPSLVPSPREGEKPTFPPAALSRPQSRVLGRGGHV